MRLGRLSKSLSLSTLALAAMANACTLPRVRPKMTPDFARGEVPVKRVALLPVDLGVQVRGKDGRIRADNALSEAVTGRIHHALTRSLRKRGYDVVAALRPNGMSPPIAGQPRAVAVIHPTDLAALRIEIHEATLGHTDRGGKLHPGQRLIEARVGTDLTRQIGDATDSDASLYARGWVYIDANSSGGASAAQIIGIVLVLLLVVGVVALLATGKGSGASGAARALAHTGKAVARTAAVMGHVMIRALPAVAEMAAHVATAPPLRCMRCAGPPPLPAPEDPLLSAAPEPAPEPEPEQTIVMRQERTLPARSTVGVAMSLVHNESGRVLWHAARDFQVEAQGEGKVEQLIDHFVKELPRADRRRALPRRDFK